MTAVGINRRRLLRILAAGATLPLLSEPRAPAYEWRGQALGAEARLRLVHRDAAEARRAVAFCLDEIARLERAFSLFDPDSELSRLNRGDRLAAASHDLRAVLTEAGHLSRLSAGAFDVTVQPLWLALARHFRMQPGTAPSSHAIDRALALVDFRQLELDGARIDFRRPGMAATLNGIAQGYITDRLAGLLRDLGFEQVLIEAGEIYALSRVEPWPVGIAGTPRHLVLANRAIATSSGPAIPFEPSRRHNHLVDPRTGASANRYASVSVVADTALRADGLSTALSLLPLDAMPSLLAALGPAEAIVVLPDGRQLEVSA
jgi:FAD:protein FMN transferase